MRSTGGATLSQQKDGSILAGGKNPKSDTYTIKANTDLIGITAIRLEALTDPSLPCTGPGRAENGNFVLDELSVKAWPRANPAAAAAVPLRNPVADFAQANVGHGCVAAAIDGDPMTGWSVHPQECLPHAAIFHTQKPIGFSGGTVLEFTLKQGWPLEHNLGRLRLSATTAKPPIAAPKPAEPRSVVVKGQLPASANGGLLVVYAQLKTGDKPVPLSAPGTISYRQGNAGRDNRDLATGAGNGTLWGGFVGLAGMASRGRAIDAAPPVGTDDYVAG